ncbi:phage baseplate assembly protein V [Hyphobacterium sp.]|uniref:phage baseplate assembly protein V n=1 Tax=Hyphobacterium sp. TaxID=2004662 RepID=UPI003B519824
MQLRFLSLPALALAPCVLAATANAQDDRIRMNTGWLPACEEAEEEMWCRDRDGRRIRRPGAETGDRGSYALPEVDDEVLTGFVEGDPDRPIAEGRRRGNSDQPAVTGEAPALGSDDENGWYRGDRAPELVQPDGHTGESERETVTPDTGDMTADPCRQRAHPLRDEQRTISPPDGANDDNDRRPSPRGPRRNNCDD